MNDVLELVRAARPDESSLDEATRRRLRERIVGGEVIATEPAAQQAGGPGEGVPDRDVDGEVRREEGHIDRRYWVSVAAILLVGLGLAAVIVVMTRPHDSAPAQQPDGGAEPVPPPYTPETVPVVEEMPDPFVDASTPATEPAPEDEFSPDDPTVIPEPAFTPLLLDVPPDGYALIRSRFEPGEGGFGIARYAHPDHDTQLQIIVRNAGVMFEGLDGRPEWQIDDRVWVDDNQLEGCLSDACSIGTIWDEHTYASLMWVGTQGGDLVAGADRESLLALAPRVVESSDGWLPVGDPFEFEELADDQSTESLLLPPVPSTVATASAIPHGPSGTQSAVVRAADGTMQVIWQVPSRADARAAWGFDDRRVIGGTEWSTDVSGQVALYRTSTPCAQVSIGDGGAGIGVGAWRDEMLVLLSAVVDDAGTTVVGLPDGWSRVGGAAGEPVYEVSFPIAVGEETSATTVTVTFRQSPGTSGGAVPDTAWPLIEPGTFMGHPAWTTSDPSQPERVGVAWSDGTASRFVSASAPAGVDPSMLLDAIENEVGSWPTSTTVDWLDTFDVAKPTPEVLDGTPECERSDLLVLD